MRLRLLGAVSVLVVASGLSASGAIAAAGTRGVVAGGIGVRLLAPAEPTSGNPLAHSYIVGVLAPGSSISRRVAIDNSTRQPVSVAVYPGAASLQHGLFTFASGRRRNELASWTSLSSSVLHVAAGGTALVTVVVNIPRTASPGERYAVVWAELAAASNGGVRLVNRVGIRLYLTVGPGGTAPAAFTIGRLRTARSAGGAPLLHAAIRNSGPRTLLIGGSLTLSHGPGDSSAGPFPATLTGALSPGAVAEIRVALGRRLPAGPWTARLRLRSGQVERVAVARISFPRRPVTAAPVVADRSDRHLLLVVFDLLVAAIVALLAMGGRAWFVRARTA